MNKSLEKAVDKVKTLTEQRQIYAAEILERFAEMPDDIYILSEEEESLVRESLNDPRPLASETEVRAVFDKYR